MSDDFVIIILTRVFSIIAGKGVIVKLVNFGETAQ